MYEEVIQLLNDNIQFLKKNDFDAIVRRVPSIKLYWKLYEFCLNELGTNILDYMTTIPDFFFRNFNMSAMVIPENIKSVGMIGNTNIHDFTVNSDAPLRSSSFSESPVETVTIGDGIKRIPSRAFSNCQNLKRVVLPSSVTEIGNDAFPEDNENLIIVAPYRDVDRLRVPRAEINWYKKHLRHRHAPANASVEDN